MRKEYTKHTIEKMDENMQPTGEKEEKIFVSLIADEGKRIREKGTGILGTRVDIGDGSSEDDFEEVAV